MPKTRIIEANTIGGRLRAAREHKKLTLEKIGEHLGVSAQAVSQWEYGETQPSLDKLCMLVQLLELQLDVVVGMRHGHSVLAELTARLEQVLEVLPTAQSAIIDLSIDRAAADGVYLVRLRKGDRGHAILGRLVFNFILKSQAALIYRLALEAGVAAEVARVIRDGTPSERRAHDNRAHQHQRPRGMARSSPPRR